MPIKERLAVFGVGLPFLERNMERGKPKEVVHEVETFSSSRPWKSLEGSLEVIGEDTVKLYSLGIGEQGEIYIEEEINDLGVTLLQKSKRSRILSRQIIWRRR